MTNSTTTSNITTDEDMEIETVTDEMADEIIDDEQRVNTPQESHQLTAKPSRYFDDAVSEDPAVAGITQMPVDADTLRKIVEGAILASGQPMTVARLLELFDVEVAPTKEEVQAALEDIQADCGESGYELKEVASGWRFQVRDELAPWVNRLWEEKPQKYSRALLETLALIAYRQPITRGDIEEIRGVAVSSHIIKTLLERDWVKVVGHRDVPGRPSLYASTRQFLDYFNLKSLDELPSLSEIRDLDEINPLLDLREEGIGEKDTDPTISNESSAVSLEDLEDPDNNLEDDFESESTESHFDDEEFVDGEEAFEPVDEKDIKTDEHKVPEGDNQDIDN